MSVVIHRGPIPGTNVGHHWFENVDGARYGIEGGPGPDGGNRGWAYVVVARSGIEVDDSMFTFAEIREWAECTCLACGANLTDPLAEFLRARIEDDEERSLSGHHGKPDRIARDCEAKRRIVEHCEPDLLAGSPGDPYVLQLLALPYADHADYRAEWRP